jgi:glyoxylase-like metal-dependent hydrolase (beta-lactamase superfamily II)
LPSKRAVLHPILSECYIGTIVKLRLSRWEEQRKHKSKDCKSYEIALQWHTIRSYSQMTTLHAFTFNAFGEQTYLLDHGDGAATVFDPGMSTKLEQQEFAKFCEELGVEPVQCLLTHAHLDHIMGAAWVFARWGLKPRLHPLDTATYEQAPRAAALYGVLMEDPPALGSSLAVGERIRCGSSELEVRLAPGHAPGHVVFVEHQQGWVVGGDVLFERSVGRTDLPGCNPEDLVNSIVDVLFSLPDDFEVWPGHGSVTTIGIEKSENPYVNAAGTGMMQREKP